MNKQERDKRRRASILEFLGDNPGSNRSGIIEGVSTFGGLNKQMVTNLLGQLRDTGSIRKEGDRRSTTWFVVSPEEPKEVSLFSSVFHDRLLAKKRMDNALLPLVLYVTTLEEGLAEERSRPKVNQEYADLRSAVYNFLGGLTTVADLREALGDDE